MFTLLFLFVLFMAGAIYLGASAVYLAMLILFKVAWLGVRMLFGLGRLAVFLLLLPLIALVVLIKISGLILLVGGAMLAVLAIGLVAKMIGGPRRPAQSYAADYRGTTRGGSSIRTSTLYHLDSTLRRMERRMADLEAELDRNR